MFIISEKLLVEINNSNEVKYPIALAREAGISIGALNNSLAQKTVQLTTLAKIAGVFNFELKESYIVINNPNKKERGVRDFRKDYINKLAYN